MSNKKSNLQIKEKNPPTYWQKYWQRVIYGKGTVAEPWPTAEELWKEPEVKKIIEWNNELIRKKSKSLG